jgi:hypothetical protein
LMTWCGWKIGTAGRVQKINLNHLSRTWIRI